MCINNGTQVIPCANWALCSVSGSCLCHDGWSGADCSISVKQLYPAVFFGCSISLTLMLGAAFVFGVIFFLEYGVRGERTLQASTVALLFASLGALFGSLFWGINPWGMNYPVSFREFVFLGMLGGLETAMFSAAFAVNIAAFLASLSLSPAKKLCQWSRSGSVFFACSVCISFATVICCTILTYTMSLTFRVVQFSVLGVQSAFYAIFLICLCVIIARKLNKFRSHNSNMIRKIILRVFVISIVLLLSVLVLVALVIANRLVQPSSAAYLIVRIASGGVEVAVAVCFLYLGKFRKQEIQPASIALPLMSSNDREEMETHDLN